MSGKRYSESRPNIPMDIKREVQVHAKHRCQVCSGTAILEFHHIDENRENNSFDNIIYLCGVCLGRAHKNEIDKKSLYLYKNKTSAIQVNTSNEDEKAIKKIKELLPWRFISSLRNSAYASDFRYDTFFPFEYFLEECNNSDFFFQDTIRETNKKQIQDKINIIFRIIGQYKEEPNPGMYIIGPKRHNLQENDLHNELRHKVLEDFNYALLDIYDLYHDICK